MGQLRTRAAFTADKSKHQEQRRDDFIARSKAARLSAIEQARQLAADHGESASDTVRASAP